jgi:hypothetical protein
LKARREARGQLLVLQPKDQIMSKSVRNDQKSGVGSFTETDTDARAEELRIESRLIGERVVRDIRPGVKRTECKENLDRSLVSLVFNIFGLVIES